MQFITNQTKGGIDFIANLLVCIYGPIKSNFKFSNRKETLVTHYDSDLLRALILSIFGILFFKKIHIVHVNPVNLRKSKFIIRSIINLIIYKLASLCGWRFVFISRENYSTYRNFVPSIYIPNPILKTISKPHFKCLSANEPIRFVNMGRFDFQKNQRESIRFIQSMEMNYPNNEFEYNFYGDGVYKDEFEKMIRDSSYNNKVHIHNWSQNVKKDLILYDIYLQTSLWEGLPTIVVEALNEGIRVISYPLASSASLLSNSCYFDEYFDLGSFLKLPYPAPDLSSYQQKLSLEKHKEFHEKIHLLHL